MVEEQTITNIIKNSTKVRINLAITSSNLLHITKLVTLSFNFVANNNWLEHTIIILDNYFKEVINGHEDAITFSFVST
jgi:hypothetical protein